MADRSVEVAAFTVAGAVVLVIGALLVAPETYGAIDVGAATAWSAELGILTPAVVMSGVGPRWLSVLWIAGCTCAVFLFAPRTRAAPSVRPDASTKTTLLLIVVLAGVAARVVAAILLPLDPDTTVYQVGPNTPTFCDDHDTWVHPPAFRAVQLAWLALVGGGLDSAPILFRGPSLTFAIAGFAFFARSVREVGGARAAAGALVPLALSPDVVGDSVFARPYSLAALLFAVTLFGWARGGATHRVMLVAAGLCAWVDVPYGVAAAVCCVMAAHPSRLARLRTVLVLLLFWLPLLPGAVQATLEPVAAIHVHGPTDAVIAGQHPSSGLGRGSVLRLWFDLASFAVIGMVDLLPGVLIVLGTLGGLVRLRALRRAYPVTPSVLLFATFFALCLVAGTARSIRERNVAFLVAAAALVLAEGMRWLAASRATREAREG